MFGTVLYRCVLYACPMGFKDFVKMREAVKKQLYFLSTAQAADKGRQPFFMD
jgi:hypothetical protein